MQSEVVCRLSPFSRGKEVNARGEPVVRLTLLMRRGSRSFADPTAVISVSEGECALVQGCMMEVAQSEDLSFCDQVCHCVAVLFLCLIRSSFSRFC